MITDPVSDFLARVRNAQQAGHASIELPTSRLVARIAEILRETGYLAGAREVEAKPRNRLRVALKYGEDGRPAIRKIQRVSRPSRRVYRGADALRPVLRGIGLAVVSTSRGVLSDRECRRQRLGGEVLLQVW